MESDFERVRKAAILIASVDQDVADELLGRMTPPEAALVRQALVDLQEIDSLERQQVFDEFQELRKKEASSPDGSSAVPTVGDSAAGEYVATATGRGGQIESTEGCDTVFAGVGATHLAEFLKEESPQIGAVVLSQLEASHASEVLAHLPDATQMAVLSRLARLDQPSAEVVREVTRALGARLQSHNVAAAPSAGIRALARVLSATENRERSKLIERLARDDRDVALLLSRVKDADDSNAQRGAKNRPVTKTNCEAAAASYTFSDLVQFDNSSLRTLIRESDSEILALAISGASDEFVDRVLGLIPFFHVRAFERRMQRLGPVRLRDIEQAQARLAELANELSGRGRIVPPETMKHLNMAA